MSIALFFIFSPQDDGRRFFCYKLMGCEVQKSDKISHELKKV